MKTGRKGKVYSSDIGNPSKQVKRNALALRKFLSERLGLNTYVNGIVCFTNLENQAGNRESNSHRAPHLQLEKLLPDA